jgi:hypothetical protein
MADELIGVAFPRGLRVIIRDRSDLLSNALSASGETSSSELETGQELPVQQAVSSGNRDWIAYTASLIDAVAAVLPDPESA